MNKIIYFECLCVLAILVSFLMKKKNFTQIEESNYQQFGNDQEEKNDFESE